MVGDHMGIPRTVVFFAVFGVIFSDPEREVMGGRDAQSIPTADSRHSPQ
jgi:hypothetical protein